MGRFPPFDLRCFRPVSFYLKATVTMLPDKISVSNWRVCCTRRDCVDAETKKNYRYMGKQAEVVVLESS
jgi:hypothetical protein